MKKFLLAFFLLFTMTSFAQTTTDTSHRLLRHVVLFKFKANAAPADVQKIETAFRALRSQIQGVKDFEWGTNNSPEGLNDGFTHCFFVSFASEKDRAAYLPHPAHQAFVALLKPLLDKALVIDYWASK